MRKRFLGEVNTIADNTKTGMTRAHRYDPDLNPTYYNFALHCGFGIVPALRQHKLFSVEELNAAVRELLTELNHRPFRKRNGTRASVFAAIDKSALKPLPAEPFDLSEWSRQLTARGGGSTAGNPGHR
jgi:hypothetical protein